VKLPLSKRVEVFAMPPAIPFNTTEWAAFGKWNGEMARAAKGF